MKESIIKISTPIAKVQLKPSEDESQVDITQAEEISWGEELQQLESEPEPEPEPIDFRQQNSARFVTPYSSGWKVSDILREIRLDNFEMGDIN
ncbi:MAG: hypothetical protein PUP93_02375 [Rhizonema sp. NSF051]|nr:hypothetical protein [Rhizonema sp. NSF051]